MLDRGE